MRTLSSPFTFFHKFIFPLPFIGVSIFWSYNYLALNEPYSICDFLLALWLIATLLLIIMGNKIKRVKIDERALYISNYFKTVQVDFSNVKSVTGSILIRPDLIWISFHSKTAFGLKIVLIPDIVVIRLFPTTGHKYVKELNDLVKKAQFNRSLQANRFPRA